MRGKFAILLIFVVAAGLVGFGWWYNRHQGKRSLKAWGSEAAVLIRYAPRVDLLQLDEPGGGPPSAEILSLDGRSLEITARTEISGVRGLVHARHALIEDASFRWTDDPGSCQSEWKFALQFIRQDTRATLAFDPRCDRVQLVEAGRQVRLRPELMQAYQQKAEAWTE